MGPESRNADRYRTIAEEMRATAQLVTSADARRSLFEVADAYERMAATLDTEESAKIAQRGRLRG